MAEGRKVATSKRLNQRLNDPNVAAKLAQEKAAMEEEHAPIQRRKEENEQRKVQREKEGKALGYGGAVNGAHPSDVNQQKFAGFAAGVDDAVGIAQAATNKLAVKLARKEARKAAAKLKASAGTSNKTGEEGGRPEDEREAGDENEEGEVEEDDGSEEDDMESDDDWEEFEQELVKSQTAEQPPPPPPTLGLPHGYSLAANAPTSNTTNRNPPPPSPSASSKLPTTSNAPPAPSSIDLSFVSVPSNIPFTVSPSTALPSNSIATNSPATIVDLAPQFKIPKSLPLTTNPSTSTPTRAVNNVTPCSINPFSTSVASSATSWHAAENTSLASSQVSSTPTASSTKPATSLASSGISTSTMASSNKPSTSSFSAPSGPSSQQPSTLFNPINAQQEDQMVVDQNEPSEPTPAGPTAMFTPMVNSIAAGPPAFSATVTNSAFAGSAVGEMDDVTFDEDEKNRMDIEPADSNPVVESSASESRMANTTTSNSVPAALQSDMEIDTTPAQELPATQATVNQSVPTTPSNELVMVNNTVSSHGLSFIGPQQPQAAGPPPVADPMDVDETVAAQDTTAPFAESLASLSIQSGLGASDSAAPTSSNPTASTPLDASTSRPSASLVSNNDPSQLSSAAGSEGSIFAPTSAAIAADELSEASAGMLGNIKAPSASTTTADPTPQDNSCWKITKGPFMEDDERSEDEIPRIEEHLTKQSENNENKLALNTSPTPATTTEQESGNKASESTVVGSPPVQDTPASLLQPIAASKDDNELAKKNHLTHDPASTEPAEQAQNISKNIISPSVRNRQWNSSTRISIKKHGRSTINISTGSDAARCEYQSKKITQLSNTLDGKRWETIRLATKQKAAQEKANRLAAKDEATKQKASSDAVEITRLKSERLNIDFRMDREKRKAVSMESARRSKNFEKLESQLRTVNERHQEIQEYVSKTLITSEELRQKEKYHEDLLRRVERKKASSNHYRLLAEATAEENDRYIKHFATQEKHVETLIYQLVGAQEANQRLESQIDESEDQAKQASLDLKELQLKYAKLAKQWNDLPQNKADLRAKINSIFNSHASNTVTATGTTLREHTQAAEIASLSEQLKKIQGERTSEQNAADLLAQKYDKLEKEFKEFRDASKKPESFDRFSRAKSSLNTQTVTPVEAAKHTTVQSQIEISSTPEGDVALTNEVASDIEIAPVISAAFTTKAVPTIETRSSAEAVSLIEGASSPNFADALHVAPAARHERPRVMQQSGQARSWGHKLFSCFFSILMILGVFLFDGNQRSQSLSSVSESALISTPSGQSFDSAPAVLVQDSVSFVQELIVAVHLDDTPNTRDIETITAPVPTTILLETKPLIVSESLSSTKVELEVPSKSSAPGHVDREESPPPTPIFFGPPRLASGRRPYGPNDQLEDCILAPARTIIKGALWLALGRYTVIGVRWLAR